MAPRSRLCFLRAGGIYAKPRELRVRAPSPRALADRRRNAQKHLAAATDRAQPPPEAAGARGEPLFNLTFAKGRPVALVPRGRPLATTSPAAVTGSVCASGVRLTLRYSGFNLTFAKGRPVALVPRGLPLATTSPARVAGSFCASSVRLTLRDSGLKISPQVLEKLRYKARCMGIRLVEVWPRGTSHRSCPRPWCRPAAAAPSTSCRTCSHIVTHVSTPECSGGVKPLDVAIRSHYRHQE